MPTLLDYRLPDTVQDDVVLSPADVHALELGRDFEQLVNSAAWNVILDWMENRSNKALTDHKMSMSTDPVIEHTMKMRWRERDETLTEFQKWVYGTIESKRAMVKLLLESGMEPTQLEAVLSKVRPNIVG